MALQKPVPKCARLTRHEECKEWQPSGDTDTEDVEGWSENEKVSQHVRVHLGPEAERDGWLFMFETMSKELGHVRLVTVREQH